MFTPKDKELNVWNFRTFTVILNEQKNVLGTGYSWKISCHFIKGDNFCIQVFASLVSEIFQERGYSWKKSIPRTVLVH